MLDSGKNAALLPKLLQAMSAISIGLLLTYPAGASQVKQRHFSTLEGRTIRMQPSGASFQIPPDWDGVYSEEVEIKKVKSGRGEWATEYAKVVNSALPFANCSVQAGRYLWGAPTFFGVTMRGYVFESGAEEIEARISTKGLSAAQAIRTSTASNPSIDKKEIGEWHNILIHYNVWYYDYGGKANVEFYITSQGKETIVLVFMYAGSDPHDNRLPIQQLLNSFSWPQPAR
jgi:hypothetical protein